MGIENNEGANECVLIGSTLEEKNDYWALREITSKLTTINPVEYQECFDLISHIWVFIEMIYVGAVCTSKKRNTYRIVYVISQPY